MKSNPAAFLIIDKPQGITSHDVVHRVRKLTGIKQVGHAGTLDPMATGVMVVALGKACRLLRFLEGDKTYLATIKLGLLTDTDDIEGKVIEENPAAVENPPTLETISAELKNFLGDIEQIPPYFSAIHVDGKRLYELARAGAPPPEIKARPVTIHSLDLIAYEAPLVTVRVHCSAGTYIRSIARDLGMKLGLGGTLSALRRETSGRFNLSRSQTLEELKDELANKPDGEADKQLIDRVINIEDALSIPTLTLEAELARRLVMGQRIAASDLPASGDGEAAIDLDDEEQFFLVSDSISGKPFCVARPAASKIDESRCLAPEVVFRDV